MSSARKAQPYRSRKAKLLLGETFAEEVARLEKEIATHPVTRCEPGVRKTFLFATGSEQQAHYSSLFLFPSRSSQREGLAIQKFELVHRAAIAYVVTSTFGRTTLAVSPSLIARRTFRPFQTSTNTLPTRP
jgi:hypothetical protein